MDRMAICTMGATFAGSILGGAGSLLGAAIVYRDRPWIIGTAAAMVGALGAIIGLGALA